MSDLERKLAALPPEAFFPPAPDLAERVERAIAVEPPPRARAGGRLRRAFALGATRRLRPVLALSLVALVAGAGALAASPDARSAILRFLGLEGARIERRQPAVPRSRAKAPLRLGEPVSLREARRRAGFTVLVPASGGAPGRVYFDPRAAPGGQVGFTFGRGLALIQLRARVTPVIAKAAGAGTRIERVEVDGGRGYWLEGERHEFAYVDSQGAVRSDTSRLAGDTLLWERGGLLLRLEGAASKAAALRIARSAR